MKSLFANIISPKVNECKRYKFAIITPMDNYFRVKTCADPKSFSRGWGGGPRDIFVSCRKFEFESTPLIRALNASSQRGHNDDKQCRVLNSFYILNPFPFQCVI